MFILQNLNVCKIVDSEVKKDKLLKMGFVEIQTPINYTSQYSELSFFDLKKVASEKGINTYKLKKDELLKALHESEG